MTFVEERLKEFAWVHTQVRTRLGWNAVRLFHPGDWHAAFWDDARATKTLSLGDDDVQVDRLYPSMPIVGMRLMMAHGVEVADVHLPGHGHYDPSELRRVQVVRVKDLARLCKALDAVSKRKATMPVLVEPLEHDFRWNTIGFLDRGPGAYREYGIDFRRGVLLAGTPGNGKTMACRWLVWQCKEKGYAHRVVSPDDYLKLKQHHRVRELFRFDDYDTITGMKLERKRGIIIFDDVDVALRPRAEGMLTEGWDQAMFLNHLQGVDEQEGIVYVFTTNTPVDQLDEALCRPGRIDVILHFDKPSGAMIQKFMDSWPAAVLDYVPEDAATTVEGMSFAEVDEVRRLLVFGYMEDDVWNWGDAVARFHRGRKGREKKAVAGLSPAGVA